MPFFGADITLFFFWLGFARRAAEVEKDDVCGRFRRFRDAIDHSEGRRDSRRRHIEEDILENEKESALLPQWWLKPKIY
jgi:hypothetical protein